MLPAVKAESRGKRKSVTPGTPPETSRAVVAAQQDASANYPEASIARTHSIGGLGLGNYVFH